MSNEADRTPPRGKARLAWTSLVATGLLVAGMTSAARAGSVAPTRVTVDAPGVPRPTNGFQQIQHVVVIFQENRSFDETLGSYCLQRAVPCDGYVGPVTLKNGQTVAMTPSPDVISPDIPHTVASQTAVVNGGKMDGWNIPGCTPNGTNLCLTYYDKTQIPSMAAFADNYAVSDRTFSMAGSPSWGGHMWPVAASQDNFSGDIPQKTPGVTSGPGWGCDSNLVAKWTDPSTQVATMEPSCVPAPHGQLDPTTYPYDGAFRATKAKNIPTIMDRLDAKGLSWKIYSSVYQWSICPTFASCLYSTQKANVVPTVRILNDIKNGALPNFSVLLPTGPNGTGQHPPGSMLVGDNWIGQIVNAIQTGPQWGSTAIFITYDDCGCFYDHVPPGVNPDGTLQGVRVPMVIISPFTKKGYTDSTPATAASILRFTERALGLTALGINDAKAYDYRNSFNFTLPSTPARVLPAQARIPAATQRYLDAHPEVTDEEETDPT